MDKPHAEGGAAGQAAEGAATTRLHLDGELVASTARRQRE